MDLLDWGQQGDTGWGPSPVDEEGGGQQQNQKKTTKKQEKNSRSRPSPVQQGSQSQPYDQQQQQVALVASNAWEGEAANNDWGATGDLSGGGGWNNGNGGRGRDAGSRSGWDVALAGGGNNGGGQEVGGEGYGNQWLQAANQTMSRSSHQRLPENVGRALTLADLVKQIVTGNPSRTLWYAATDLSRNLLGEDAHAVDELQYLESGGAALEEAETALYSSQRPASQRIHWTFSPMKDDRVAQLLDWIQVMSYALGTLGLQHFLVTQQRGALISNVGFRNPNHPSYPAFDWLTFDDVVETRDKTLQESIARYDPESHVLVLPVPNAVLKQNHAEAAKVMNSLAKHKYVIKKDAPAKQKKWYHIRW